MKSRLITFLGLLWVAFSVSAQNTVPLIEPQGTFTDDNGEEQSST